MSKTAAEEARVQSVLRRLAAIQGQLAKRPRSGRCQGKVAIVTGAGSKTGIGRATATQLAHEGVKALYIVDFNGEHFPEFKEELKSKYPDVKVEAVECDAADAKSIEELCKRAVKEHGQLDIFFANAAIATGAPLVATEGDDLTETLRVNVNSCFLALKYASEAMKVTSASKPDSGGSIVMTASVAGLRSGAGSVDYSASKAAVINLAATGAWQLRGTNIRVNAVCPGLIETGMTEAVFESAKARGTYGKIGQLNPTVRGGVSQEIANGVTFLASDEASYVNGTALVIDGGLSSSHPVVPGKFH